MKITGKKTILKKIAIIWLIVGLIFAASSENGLLTLAAFGLVPLFFMLHWRRGQYPILLFILGMQWLQTVMKVFHANAVGEPVENLFVSSSVVTAIWYSMAGLLALAIGMRIGAGKRTHPIPLNGIYAYSQRQLWFAYLVAMAASILLKGIIFAIPQLTQILLPLLNIRWVFFLLLLSCALVRRSGYQLVIFSSLLEIIFGFTGYFSGFKTVFFYILIAYFTFRPNITKREVVLGGLLLTLVLSLSLFWTTIKVDYREFLNQGSGQQVVNRSLSERFSWLGAAIYEPGATTLGDATEDLADRISYVDFFASSIMWVPARVDYQGGALWGAAFQHIFMPRLLFPDKPRLPSDSEQTMQFTGLILASDAQGTSISIGYMGESYIDFGFPGMLAPIFLVGILYGFIYRYFNSRESGNGVASALAVVTLLGVMQLEMHTVKLLGSVVMAFIVYALVLKYITPMVMPLIRRQKPLPA